MVLLLDLWGFNSLQEDLMLVSRLIPLQRGSLVFGAREASFGVLPADLIYVFKNILRVWCKVVVFIFDLGSHVGISCVVLQQGFLLHIKLCWTVILEFLADPFWGKVEASLRRPKVFQALTEGLDGITLFSVRVGIKKGIIFSCLLILLKYLLLNVI